MSSRTRYEVAIPVGAPAALFIPLYAEELRKKLVPLIGMGQYDIRVEKVSKEEYAIRALRGAFSGLEVVVEKKFAWSSDESRATVQLNAYSKTEHVLVKMSQVVWLLLAIPAFFLVLPFVRFIIISFFLAVLLLAPVMLALRAVIALVMSLAYSGLAGEFDMSRRVAMIEALRQAPVPDPLAAFRLVAKVGKVSPPVAPKSL